MAVAMTEDDSKDRVGTLSHAIDPQDLKPGDHIYVYRKCGIYQHHGIYVGERGIEVIHLSGEPGERKTQAKVLVTTLKEFLNGGKLRIVTYGLPKHMAFVKVGGSSQHKESKPAEEVIAMAKLFAQNPDYWPEYHVIRNNCERFAIFCKTGEGIEAHKELNQQKRYAAAGGAAATVGTAVAIGATVLVAVARAL